MSAKPVLAGVVGLIVIGSIVSSCGSSNDAATSTPSISSALDTPPPIALGTDVPTVPTVPTDIPTEVVPSPQAGTPEQQNALTEAQQYLDTAAFSRKGLIDQLKYGGYSTADATYAVDNVGADWMAEAVKSAKEYLATSSFSRSALVDQLEYEGFSAAQANFGATGAGR